jgi:hypothetical protein
MGSGTFYRFRQQILEVLQHPKVSHVSKLASFNEPTRAELYREEDRVTKIR